VLKNYSQVEAAGIFHERTGAGVKVCPTLLRESDWLGMSEAFPSRLSIDAFGVKGVGILTKGSRLSIHNPVAGVEPFPVGRSLAAVYIRTRAAGRRRQKAPPGRARRGEITRPQTP
jgi:hypothetical protein